MTILDEGVTDTSAEIEAPADAGEGVVEATQEETSDTPAEEPEIEYLDTSELGDRYVKLTIDGEEKSVPLSEALQGYNSNAAATKRFQEASALKAEASDALKLAQAVQNDPGLTMQILAKQAGLSVDQFLNLTPGQQKDIAADQAPEPTFENAWEKQLYEERQERMKLEQRFEQREREMEQQRADESLRGVVQSLKNQYSASDEDIQPALEQAFEMNAPFEMLPLIFQAQQFQKQQAQSSVKSEVEQKAAAETAARQAAAAQASNQVTTGQSANGTAAAQVVHPMTPEEAVRAALESHGIE